LTVPARVGVRALALALLVPIVGAALGVAAFAREDAHQTWRPEVARTATGWRIVQAGGRPPWNPVVGGENLVWTWGGDTILMDLATGRTRLLGIAGRATAVMPASASERFIVWVEGISPIALTGARTTYVYDTRSGRRYALPADVRPVYSPILVGDVAIWIDRQDGAGEIRSYDLATGHRAELAAGDISYPLLADSPIVAWYAAPFDSRDPPPLRVKDTATGVVTTVVPPPHDPGDQSAYAGWVDVSDGVLLGLGTDRKHRGNTVMVHDLTTGANRVLGTARADTLPAIDAGLVVWVAATGAAPGTSLLTGRRLDGGPAFEIARAKGLVARVSLSGETAAWLTLGSTGAWMETAKAPR